MAKNKIWWCFSGIAFSSTQIRAREEEKNYKKKYIYLCTSKWKWDYLGWEWKIWHVLWIKIWFKKLLKRISRLFLRYMCDLRMWIILIVAFTVDIKYLVILKLEFKFELVLVLRSLTFGPKGTAKKNSKFSEIQSKIKKCSSLLTNCLNT